MNSAKKVHVATEQFPRVDGELKFGGHSLPGLAEIAGQTPFYAYDGQILSQQLDKLRKALPDDIELHYAMKANPMPELLAFLAPLVDGIDVASLGELTVALESEISAENISFAGPGKSITELTAAVSNGILINCESLTELQRISDISQQQGTKARVALRVNPDFTLKSSGMKMGGGPQQFGIDAEMIPEILQSFQQYSVKFMGFHIFSGSQNLQASSLVDCQNQTLDLALRLTEFAPKPPQIINIGGGFGIPYFAGEENLDVAEIGANLKHRLKDFKTRLPRCKLALELGRFISGPAGIYVARITDIKLSRGQKFLIVDGGLHHHLAASGNFGQIIRKNYPVTIATKKGNNELEQVSVVGPLCTPLDILADKMLLPRAEIGDLVVVLQSGAYGFTASPGNFLSHPALVEVFI